jgi:hypothetical protein
MKTLISKDMITWSAKRASNLSRVARLDMDDDAALFAASATMLDLLATLQTGLGDDAMSIYISSLARRLESKQMQAKSANTKKQKPTRTRRRSG